MRIFLKIPDFEAEERYILSQTVTYTSACMILFSIAIWWTTRLHAPDLGGLVILLPIITIPSSVAIIFLARTEKVWDAGILLLFLLWLVVTSASLLSGGVSSPFFIGYVPVIAFSKLLSRQKTNSITAIICIITGGIIAALEMQNRLPASTPYSPAGRIGIYIFFFIVLIVFQNINASNFRKLIEQSQNNEDRYRSLLENIPTTTYINSIKKEAETIYVSPQVEKMLGYPRSAFLDTPLFWTKIIHPEDTQRVLKETERTSETGDPFNIEYRILTKNRHEVWVKDEAVLVYENGKPMYWFGVWTDITKRKHAEEEQTDLIDAMTKRTIQLQTAAEVSRAATSILDINQLLPNVVELIRSHFDYYYVGIFLIDEKSKCAILRAGSGTTGKRLLDDNHRLRIDERSMIGWSITHRQARISLDVGADAIRFANPNLPLTRSEIALPLITHGNVIGAMTIQSERSSAFSSVDMTALQAMADLVANAIENARLFTERGSLNRELEAQNEELERFAYTVSHDLRSPLVTIRGFLGYLKQAAETGNMERFENDMNRIANAVDKMQSLLNELLELSRVGRITNPPEDVRFEEIVQETLDLLSGPLEAGRIKVQVSGEFPVVHVDKLRIAETMQNLINNAIKFMGNQEHPLIEIGINGLDTDGKSIFFVRDNGIGIDPLYHERIFGLFNRLDPTVEGTGIGLTLVRRIIDIHGGRIWVESENNRGATFYFTLPISEEFHSKDTHGSSQTGRTRL